MTDILKFYLGGYALRLRNGDMMTFKEILKSNNEWWEVCHNHIQWLFPTNKLSAFNRDAPMLNVHDALVIQRNYWNFCDARERFVDFLSNTDMTKENHNHLRVTRAIESTALIFGYREAVKTLDMMVNINTNWFMPPKTKDFWTNATLLTFNDPITDSIPSKTRFQI